MHITQESDYAVRIVYCLAKCGTRRDARGISEEMCVTLRFSLKILGKLVSSGIVESYEGGAGECNRGASGCCTFQKVFHDISKSINEQLAAVNFQMLLEEPAGK